MGGQAKPSTLGPGNVPNTVSGVSVPAPQRLHHHWYEVNSSTLAIRPVFLVLSLSAISQGVAKVPRSSCHQLFLQREDDHHVQRRPSAVGPHRQEYVCQAGLRAGHQVRQLLSGRYSPVLSRLTWCFSEF